METGESTRRSFVERLRDHSTQRGWIEFDERYRDLLIRFAKRRGASSAEAEDIAQEVTLSVFKAIDNFTYDKERGRFRAYLRTAVIHALDRRKDRVARQGTPIAAVALENLADQQFEGDAEWDREWQLHRLRTALRSIAKEFEPLTLEAFRLHVLTEWSPDAVAKLLSISTASVYQAKSRVLKRLKAQIATMEHDDDL